MAYGRFVGGTFRIFAEGDLAHYLEERIGHLAAKVRGENANYLLNVNEPDYIAHLVDAFRVTPVTFDIGAAYATEREELIPADHFPPDFFVRDGGRYAKPVITYHLPFTGDPDLLRLAPNPRNMWTIPLCGDDREIWFDVVDLRGDPVPVKQEIDGNRNNILAQAAFAQRQVEQFSGALAQRAAEIVRARKDEHLKRANVMSQLGVPVRARSDVPQTFAVPSVKHTPVIAKPAAPATAFAPDPTLDEATYRRILTICRDAGREMERHPSIYEGADEEKLRDHFIMVLAPHFESVSGETFNKQGKTDILIRHEGKNVFVAECKFWGGAKLHHETIDQALSYLTWRDAKAAILYFIRNKNLDPVLMQIATETAKHPAFVEAQPAQEEGWFRFRFHLPKDETRNVHLAILCFHFPEKN